MKDVRIRLAEPNDAYGIATVHIKTWQHAYKGQIPDSYLDSLSINKRTESWKNQLENLEKGVYAYVAEVNGQVVGWCTFGVNRDEDVSKDTGELHGIYILPAYANQGVGSKLMKRAKKVLKEDGYKKATLWVLDTNEKTRKWYESKGWRVEGRTKTVTHSRGFKVNEVRYSIGLQ